MKTPSVFLQNTCSGSICTYASAFDVYSSLHICEVVYFKNVLYNYTLKRCINLHLKLNRFKYLMKLKFF